MAWLLLLSAFLSTPAEATGLRAACNEFAGRDRAALKKCVAHGELFELNGAIVQACTAFSRDPDYRMKCLKSGADVETVKLCRTTGWTIDNVASCLRYYPTAELIKSCKDLSADEEEQIKCVRLGREPSQVKACVVSVESLKGRMLCLEKDVAVAEARICSRKNRGEKARLGCMEEFVAKRDGTYFREDKVSRSLASEPLK